jgi:hypothetical protein
MAKHRTKSNEEHPTVPTPKVADRKGERVAESHQGALIVTPEAQPNVAAGRGRHASVITTANAFCTTIQSDGRIASAMRGADRTDPAIRALRRRLFDAASALAVQLYVELFDRSDADELLQRAELLQSGVEEFLSHRRAPLPIEEAIIAVSDVMADTKDPCHRSVARRRQRGIFRRPYDGMPLVYPSRDVRDDGAFFADVDALTWRWIPLTRVRSTSVDGEHFDELVPAPDAHGNVPASDFFIWQRMSRAVAYKHSERKSGRRGTRHVKRYPTIPGLHETERGLAVHIPTYVAERVDHKTNHWSAATLTSTSTGVAIEPATPLTRTERFLEQLRAEGADVTYLQQLRANDIAYERTHGIYE